MTTPLQISLAGRDLLRVTDLTPAEAELVLDTAVELKHDRRPRLAGSTLGLYFAKHSTRTRVSFSVAMSHLGGTAIPLTPEELQLSRGESLPDTARALSRYLDVLAVRTHAHEELERAQRLRDLEPYRLDEALLALASPDAFVMHCLPAHPGEEIAGEVLYGPRSAIWDEAENRLHVQKALLALLLER